MSHQRLQFGVINEVELRDEEVVMLVACIDVGLCTHAANAVKVMDVNMYKHPEETTQDLFAHLLEILGERNTCGRKEKVKCIHLHLQNSLRRPKTRSSSIIDKIRLYSN